MNNFLGAIVASFIIPATAHYIVFIPVFFFISIWIFGIRLGYA